MAPIVCWDHFTPLTAFLPALHTVLNFSICHVLNTGMAHSDYSPSIAARENKLLFDNSGKVLAALAPVFRPGAFCGSADIIVPAGGIVDLVNQHA